MEKTERIENLICLALSPGIGALGVARLLRHFGTSDAIFGASEKQLAQVEDIRNSQINAVIAARKIDPRPELELAAKAEVSLLAYDDPTYPPALLTIPDPPFLLYVKGKFLPADRCALGIVGTRYASRYGKEQSERFAAGLTRVGYTIVSGLARGVDTCAHRGALAGGGRTIAFIGCGLRFLYPPENRDLAAEIAAHGAVVSEFPMNVAPDARNFPRRNRLIAGSALGVLVVEAAVKSGSLITARQALEMGRELFVIPGNIDRDDSYGCNTLIREGAALVRGLDDILNELPPPEIAAQPAFNPSAITKSTAIALENNYENKISSPQLTQAEEKSLSKKVIKGSADPLTPSPVESFTSDEQKIVSALSSTPTHIDELADKLDLAASSLLARLLVLELRGAVKQLPGKNFVRRDESCKP